MSTQLEVSNDILLRLLSATEEIRNLLRQKSGREDSGNRYSPHHELPVEVAEIASHDDPNPIASVEASINETADDWPSDEKIMQYRERCATHRRVCERMHVELGYFNAHSRIVRNDLFISGLVESTQEVLLDPVRCLELTLNERQNVLGQMNALKFSLWTLWNKVGDLCRNLRQEDAPPYTGNMIQWADYLEYGWRNTLNLVNSGRIVEGLEFILNVFFSDLETVMSGVMEAMMIIEERYASEWLAAQKYQVFETVCEDYIIRVSPPEVSETSWSIWIDADKAAGYGERLAAHKRSCHEFQKELEHLSAHYRIVGGDKAVIEASQLLQSSLLELVRCLERALATTDERWTVVGATIVAFAKLHTAIGDFQESLYRQKHAFYFRNVKKWMVNIRNGLPRLLVFCLHCDLVGCIGYIFDELLMNLSSSMVDMGTALEESGVPKGKSAIVDSGNVAEELNTFRKESLPKFLANQMERDTTRYVSLTTIATFFSSVTATTLQFTYAPMDSEPSNSLRGAVNLFWILSLVFSVSSGVSSLLGLTYRKSSIYDACVPPKLIRLWFNKAPILFLIIAAISFVVGLNLFAYLSLQPHYVSLATSIFTGVHTACLLGVTVWFIYRLQHDSSWTKRIGKLLDWFGNLRFWKLVREIWVWIRHPQQQYREKKMHLQRNIFWAFGMDNDVARLNRRIDLLRDWPNPYLMSRAFRCIAYPMKMCWLETKNMFSNIGYFVRKHTCVSVHAGHAEDNAESKERHGQDDDEAPEETSLTAKNEFHKSLERIFSKSDLVDGIFVSIEDWEDGYEEVAERQIGRKLWGYPDLVKKFHEEVRPALVEAREKRGDEQRRFMMMWQAFNGPHLSALEGQDENQTASVEPSRPASLDDALEPMVVTQIDIQPEIQVQPNNPHPTSDRRSLPTATLTISEVAMAGDPISQSGTASPGEIEEVPSISETNDEGFHSR